MSNINNKLKPITSLKKYITIQEDRFIFKGKELKIFYPVFYHEHELVIESSYRDILGVLHLEINNKYSYNLLLSTFLTTDIIKTLFTSDDKKYKYLVYEYNEPVFLSTNTIVNLGPLQRMFTTFITLGKMPEYLTYEQRLKLFDLSTILNGKNMRVSHDILELLVAHLSRVESDMNTPYRLRKKKQDKLQSLGLNKIIYSAESISSKLLGNYLDDGLVGSLIVDEEQTKTDDIEQLIIQ